MSLSNCSNCYNGCTEIVSDKCVKYTGVDVPILGIQTGDSLSYVEQALITFLTSTLDGTGIKIDIPESILCPIVSGFLPTCGDITAVDLFETLIKTACNLQLQITNLSNQINVIEAPYTVECLTGVTSTSGTHDILQAVITKLCDVSADLVALAIDLETNYVKLSDLDDLIQAYLDSQTGSTQYYTRMVPNTVVEYYGSLSNFDSTGKGLSANGFDKIYICNGQNSTPDKRGRVPVGAISLVPGGALDVAVDPAYAGNPPYALYTKAGTNTITLSTAQLPSHTHTATSLVTDPGHFTDIKVGVSDYTEWDDNSTNNGRPITRVENVSGTSSVLATATTTTKAYTGVTVATSLVNTGSNLAHANNQPALACYYIMYIP